MNGAVALSGTSSTAAMRDELGLDQLPEQVIIKIAKLLDFVDRVKLMVLSTHLRYVVGQASEAWEDIRLELRNNDLAAQHYETMLQWLRPRAASCTTLHVGLDAASPQPPISRRSSSNTVQRLSQRLLAASLMTLHTSRSHQRLQSLTTWGILPRWVVREQLTACTALKRLALYRTDVPLASLSVLGSLVQLESLKVELWEGSGCIDLADVSITHRLPSMRHRPGCWCLQAANPTATWDENCPPTFPLEIAQLPRLVELEVTSLGWRAINYRHIGGCTQLTSLALAGSGMTLPLSTCALVNLKALKLQRMIEGEPEALPALTSRVISHLPRLEVLELRGFDNDVGDFFDLMKFGASVHCW